MEHSMKISHFVVMLLIFFGHVSAHPTLEDEKEPSENKLISDKEDEHTQPRKLYKQSPPSPFRKISLETYDYDFTEYPLIGTMLVWEISQNKLGLPAPFYGRIYGPLDPDKTYLIAMKKQLRSILHIHYWCGEFSSNDDRKKVAKLAVELFFFLQTCGPAYNVLISRELEHYESLTLKQNFRPDNKIQVSYGKIRQWDSSFDYYLDSKFLLKYRNLYLVKGDSKEVRMKKVSLTQQWVQGNHCLVMEIIDKKKELFSFILYCGMYVDPNVREKAGKLAEYFRSMYSRSNTVFQVINSNDIEQYINFTNNLNIVSSTVFLDEQDISTDDVKPADEFIQTRDRAVKLYEVSENSSWNALKNNPMLKEHVKKADIPRRKGTILDSGSIAGIFIHIDKSGPIDAAINAAQIIEDMLPDLYPDIIMPVRIVTDFSESIDYDLTFVDFIS